MTPGTQNQHPLQNTDNAQITLSVRDLHTWFELRRWGIIKVGHVRAVDGMTFDLEQGESVAFVGESGCGKSSLARTILGLHKPTQGDVIFEGTNLSQMLRSERIDYGGQVGFVQQDPYGALPSFMSVERILREPLIIHGVKNRREQNERINAALEEVRLTPVGEFRQKFPHMLSGGQQQRVVIARALILKPRLVIADEPVSMLDASVRIEILRLLQQIQKSRKLTLAFITHDLSTVRYFAERVFVIYAGKIIERAPLEDLISTPCHPYTQALLTALADPDPENAERYRELPGGEPPSLLAPPEACRFHPRCPHFMEGICDVEEPPDFSVGQKHFAACWLNQNDQQPRGHMS